MLPVEPVYKPRSPQRMKLRPCPRLVNLAPLIFATLLLANGFLRGQTATVGAGAATGTTASPSDDYARRLQFLRARAPELRSLEGGSGETPAAKSAAPAEKAVATTKPKAPAASAPAGSEPRIVTKDSGSKEPAANAKDGAGKPATTAKNEAASSKKVAAGEKSGATPSATTTGQTAKAAATPAVKAVASSAATPAPAADSRTAKEGTAAPTAARAPTPKEGTKRGTAGDRVRVCADGENASDADSRKDSGFRRHARTRGAHGERSRGQRQRGRHERFHGHGCGQGFPIGRGGEEGGHR